LDEDPWILPFGDECGLTSTAKWDEFRNLSQPISRLLGNSQWIRPAGSGYYLPVLGCTAGRSTTDLPGRSDILTALLKDDATSFRRLQKFLSSAGPTHLSGAAEPKEWCIPRQEEQLRTKKRNRLAKIFASRSNCQIGPFLYFVTTKRCEVVPPYPVKR
jgi:hypothetical protein